MRVDGPDDYDRTEFWDELVQRDPAQAVRRAARVLADRGDDPTVSVLAHGASARAWFELGRLDEAQAAARRALTLLAPTVSDAARRAIVMSTAVILAESGFVEEGLETLDSLAGEGDAADQGRLELQRAYILHQAGRLGDALVHLDRGEHLLVRAGAPRDRFRVHQNRGLVLLQQGRLDAAESDLRAADAVAASLGLTASRGQTMANLGVLYGRARRLTDALAHFALASDLFHAAGDPVRIVATTEIDRAEVMMHSGLVAEAVDAARSAVELIAPTGNRTMIGDAQLMVARAELAAGMLRLASRSAETAAEIFESSGRHEMVAHARSIAAQARLRVAVAVEQAATDLTATRALADRLRSDGWHREGDELALERIRLATRVGLLDLVGDDIEQLRRHAGSPQRDQALAGWYVEALSRAASHRREAAIEACKRGLDRIDDIVAETTSLADRSGAMRLGNDLSQLTIDLAIEDGDADVALAAAEGTRARALHDELGGEERHRPLTDEGAAQLRRELAGRLGDRVLVEWIVSRGVVWAVVLTAAGGRLVQVGDVRDVRRAGDRVRMWLDLAPAEPDEPSGRAVRAASTLDELLIAPLELPAAVGVVHVPVDLLHGVPWAGLPSFAGRPMTLAPNAQVWIAADRRAAGAVRTIGFVAGPDVESAAVERSAIDRWYPGAATAAGSGATPATVRSMLAGSDLVHVAAHGRFRSDRPLLSTLRLHGGEAPLSETVPARIAARAVVLSSCEGGAQGAADGSEVLGLSSVLLARGAASVLAPLTVVRDLECADFVADVHAELAAGEPLACAVANVRARWLADDDLSRWAVASSFSCFGSGAVVVAGRDGSLEALPDVPGVPGADRSGAAGAGAARPSA